MHADPNNVIRNQPETPQYPGEPYLRSPTAAVLEGANRADPLRFPTSSPPHTASCGAAETSPPTEPDNGCSFITTPTSSALASDLPHADRITAANRVRAKAWPLVGRAWYPSYHLAAYAGWMSVPGGLCVHKGQYHAFYQHHPFSENWGPMHWGHCVSDDLAHWRHLPVALAPGESYDRDGCFSGSAVSHQGRLYLFYTGHTWGCSTNVDSEGIYQQQCLAVSDDDGVTFTKLGVVIRPPPEYIHFRDPKVWRQDGRWWMVLGARDIRKDVGQLLLYSSERLDEWDESAYRVVSRADDKNVFMWECPDFFPVNSVTFKEAAYGQSGHDSASALLRADESPVQVGPSNSHLANSGFGSASAGNSFPETNADGASSSPMAFSGTHLTVGSHNPIQQSFASSSFHSTASSSVCASVAGALASNDFVLLFCPQGLSGQGRRYRNRFQSGYLTGHWGVRGDGTAGASSSRNPNVSDRIRNMARGHGRGGSGPRKEFEITQQFKELDHGHDFYAPQTFVAPDGRRILIAWLDMWESPMPSKEHGWSGSLTIPRELTYDCASQKITMRPVRELAALRVATASIPGQVICENGELPLVEDCTAFEVSLTFNLDTSTGEKFGLWLGHGAEVFYDAQSSSVVVNRHYPDFMLSGYRACELDSTTSSTLLHLHVFFDRSSMEVFVNDGAIVFSSRIYPQEGDRALRIFTTNGVANLVEGTVWKLESEAVTH